MNIALAKRIPLADIMDKLGYKPTQHKNSELWYFSPFRKERTPSFQLNTKKNLWYDFGEGVGGDVFSFVKLYLQLENQSFTTQDALRWLSNMMGYAPRINPIEAPFQPENTEPALSVGVNIALSSFILKKYLISRGIDPQYTEPYLRELHIHNKNSGKIILALGWKNEEGGLELKNKFIKSCVGAKDITFIRGTTVKPDGIHIFEGMMDFLSIIQLRKGSAFTNDVIILNSLSMLSKATPYIKGYGYKQSFTWMDNDLSGNKASENLDSFFKTEENLKHYRMNFLYQPYKDVNEWHVRKFKLKIK